MSAPALVGHHVPRRRKALAALLATGAALAGLAPAAGAGTAGGSQPARACADDDEFVAVVQVSGRLDPVLVDFVDGEIRDTGASCAVAVVLQLNSSGAVGNEGGVDDLVETIEASPVPVAVWVGPTGNRATGAAVDLLAAADVTGVADPRASIEVTAGLLAARDVEPTELGSTDVGDRVNAERALELGLVDTDAAAIGDFVIQLPGVETEVNDDGRAEPVTTARFSKLPILGQLMHTVSSPAVAYLLFVIGLSLLVFELFTAGVGLAGVVGAGSLLLGSYGLASLPVQPVGVGLLLLAIFGYAVDIQTGVPRVWSGIATAAFVLGSLLLFDGVSLSWITLIIAIGGISLAMLSGMPTMVRSRFSTPTLGRDWMIGEMGRARTAISPDGVVTVRDAPWRARTNRATPIAKDEPVRVVAIDGLVLEVEPEEGGAQDYRERARPSREVRAAPPSD
jgi:membrane-bound serine protease (ClpP class)